MHLNREEANTILGLIDLTSLNGNETEEDIRELCKLACDDNQTVAAICVYPRYIASAKRIISEELKNNLRIATVVNFPEGDQSIEDVQQETKLAVNSGADEIDIVLPYRALLQGDIEHCRAMLSACRKSCGTSILMKVIIESGELKNSDLIEKACEISIECGADFIKTSTGKVLVNATLEAAEIILNSIKSSHKTNLGFKASGGIRTAEQAKAYLKLCESIMGKAWINHRHLRFGASALLNDIKNSISNTKVPLGEY